MMMSPFIIPVVAIICTFTMIIYSMRLKAMRDGVLPGAGSAADSAQLSSLTAEVHQLRQRVEVLEKLVTDDDRRLAGEIESLRRASRPEA